MKIVCGIIVLCLILLFTGYFQSLESQPLVLDKTNQVPIQTYPHDYLLVQPFDPQSGNVESWMVLLQRHCALIGLGVVKTQPLLDLCKPTVSAEVQACIAKYHRCFATCDAFNGDCLVCEHHAGQCLERADSGELRQRMDSGPAQAAPSRSAIHLVRRNDGKGMEAGMTDEL